MNKKALIFNIVLVILSAALLLQAFFILKDKRGETEKGVGEHELFLLKASHVADNFNFYLDESARIAAKKAFPALIEDIRDCKNPTRIEIDPVERTAEDCFSNLDNKYEILLKKELAPFIANLPHNNYIDSLSDGSPVDIGKGKRVAFSFNTSTPFHFAIEENQITGAAENPFLFTFYYPEYFHGEDIELEEFDKVRFYLSLGLTGVLLVEALEGTAGEGRSAIGSKVGTYTLPAVFRTESPFSQKEFNNVENIEKTIKRDCAQTLDRKKLEKCVKNKAKPAKATLKCEKECEVTLEYIFKGKDLQEKELKLEYWFYLKPIITEKTLEDLLPDSACNQLTGQFKKESIKKLKELGLKVLIQPIEKGQKIIIDYGAKKPFEKACTRP